MSAIWAVEEHGDRGKEGKIYAVASDTHTHTSPSFPSYASIKEYTNKPSLIHVLSSTARLCSLSSSDIFPTLSELPLHFFLSLFSYQPLITRAYTSGSSFSLPPFPFLDHITPCSHLSSWVQHSQRRSLKKEKEKKGIVRIQSQMWVAPL